MTRGLLDFAASCGQFPDALQKAQRAGVQQAAFHVTSGIRVEIRRVTPSMRLTHQGRKPKVNAGYKITGKVNPVATIRARGPLVVLNNPTPPHEIKPRRYRDKSKRKKALAFNGVARASAQHPGTRGFKMWQKGVAKTRADTPKIFNDEIVKAMRRTFR